ncbi:hypothetical protein BDW22DRAFT_702813 [Trametopsis cervina]|nr:hypothetical protein BDW22DRAFT_702813 [Trametopsis cervina]
MSSYLEDVLHTLQMPRRLTHLPRRPLLSPKIFPRKISRLSMTKEAHIQVSLLFLNVSMLQTNGPQQLPQTRLAWSMKLTTINLRKTQGRPLPVHTARRPSRSRPHHTTIIVHLTGLSKIHLTNLRAKERQIYAPMLNRTATNRRTLLGHSGLTPRRQRIQEAQAGGW